MNNDIYLYSNCNKLENIKLKVSGSILGDRIYSQYHTIKYDKNKSVKIQSPLCKVFLKNRNWLNLRMPIEEKKYVEFIKHWTNLIKKLQKLTQNKYSKTILWDTTKSYNGSKTFSAKIFPGCLYFDTKQNLLQLDDKIINSTVDLIFGISTIQIVCPFDEKDILFGKIIIDILQIRKHTIFAYNIQENLFKDNDSFKENHCQVDSNYQKYSKYFDMLKKGVPKQAIELKMSSEGVDPSILSYNTSKLNYTSKIQNNQINNKSNKTVNILANDLMNVKLKKVTTNLKSKKKLSMGVSLGISLEAIQNSLKNLKKTCI